MTPDLLLSITRRAAEDDADIAPPLDDAAIARAEADLGFALHPLLAAAYRQVGNGGFGPECEVLPLTGAADAGETAVRAYLDFRATFAGTEWAWPEGVLPILTWGCGMYACVDCRSDDGTVLLFEPNPGDPDAAWYVDSATLEGWFAHYVNDTGWWVAAEEGEDYDPLPRWPHARARA